MESSSIKQHNNKMFDIIIDIIVQQCMNMLDIFREKIRDKSLRKLSKHINRFSNIWIWH